MLHDAAQRPSQRPRRGGWGQRQHRTFDVSDHPNWTEGGLSGTLSELLQREAISRWDGFY